MGSLSSTKKTKRPGALFSPNKDFNSDLHWVESIKNITKKNTKPRFVFIQLFNKQLIGHGKNARLPDLEILVDFFVDFKGEAFSGEESIPQTPLRGSGYLVSG